MYICVIGCKLTPTTQIYTFEPLTGSIDIDNKMCIRDRFKGDNMENSNQIEAPVKFGILEEEKVSRKFYPVKNAPADTVPVSYTHLDVYKRQGIRIPDRIL